MPSKTQPVVNVVIGYIYIYIYYQNFTMATFFGRLLGHFQANTKHYVYRCVLNGIPFRFTYWPEDGRINGRNM
jgi:hypothetical protein